jgi:MYXO-CTERM domain-containing protein
VPGVIGYDIMNEPWGDEATELAALHRDAGQAIRSADPSAILFLSPHAIISAGFSATQLPAPTFANAAYSPHFYDGSVLFGGWGGTPPDDPFRYMRGTADAWGVPLLVGEIGGPATADNVGGYMDAIYERLDETFASATQWVYTPAWTADAKDGWNAEDLSIVDDTGALRANFRVRPYAQRISGTPVSARATHEAVLSDNVFELAWDHVPSGGTTDVFLPREVFFGTPNVIVVTEGDAVDCAFQGTRLSCSSAVAGAKKVIVRAGGTDAGAGEARPMSDAEARDAEVGSPVSASGGGCACRTASRHENGGDRNRLTLFGLGLAAAVRRRRRQRPRQRPRRTRESSDGRQPADLRILSA